jgi:hypothetical protein
VCLLQNKYCLGGEVKGDEIGQNCRTPGGIDVCDVLFGVPEGKDQLGYVRAYGRNVVKWALKKWAMM